MPLPTPALSDTPRVDALYRRITWRLVPFLMLCYVAAFLDRVNIGFAKLQMFQDLGMSDTVFGLGAGLFFLGYFLFEVPSNLMMHRVGARATLLRIMLLWGVISALFAFVKTPTEFYVLRFLLGAAEAGFYPGILLYLTYWFPANRRAKATALFICAIPLSGIIGGPLSGWILSFGAHQSGMANWQMLFIIEAVPSIVLGLLIMKCLDNSIDSAKWLNAEEKRILQDKLAADRIARGQTAQTAPVSAARSNALLAALRDKYVYMLMFICFFQAMGQYGLSFWMPTLIRQTGVTSPQTIGFLMAIPSLFAIVAMLLMGRSSDARRERRWHLILAFAVGAVGLLASGHFGASPWPTMIGLSIAAAGCYTVTAIFWSIPASFLTGAAAAGGIALINTFGSLAGFFSPYLVGAVKDATHSTDLALYLIAVTMVLGAILTYLLPSRLADN